MELVDGRMMFYWKDEDERGSYWYTFARDGTNIVRLEDPRGQED